MKAVIKETGEIVAVSRIETTRLEGKLIGAHEIFSPKDLELSCIDADWEQRRYELAKAAMQGLLANYNNTNANIYSLAEDSCDYADAVIERLKGGDK